jgi:hypothetical protein
MVLKRHDGFLQEFSVAPLHGCSTRSPSSQSLCFDLLKRRLLSSLSLVRLGVEACGARNAERQDVELELGRRSDTVQSPLYSPTSSPLSSRQHSFTRDPDQGARSSVYSCRPLFLFTHFSRRVSVISIHCLYKVLSALLKTIN